MRVYLSRFLGRRTSSLSALCAAGRFLRRRVDRSSIIVSKDTTKKYIEGEVEEGEAMQEGARRPADPPATP